jgi:hypothetical protein
MIREQHGNLCAHFGENHGNMKTNNRNSLCNNVTFWFGRLKAESSIMED